MGFLRTGNVVRRLQDNDEGGEGGGETYNIFIIYCFGEDCESEEETLEPTTAPTYLAEPRDSKHVFCVPSEDEDGDEDEDEDGDADDEDDADEGGEEVVVKKANETLVAYINFIYDIEFDTEVLPADAEDIMLESLTDSMMESIQVSSCGRRLLSTSSDSLYVHSDNDESDDNPTTGRQQQQQRRRRHLEIEYITSDSKDAFRESCTPVNENSVGCNRYNGTLAVGYNTLGGNADRVTVGNSVLYTIEKDMENGSYLTNMADAMNSTGVDVTGVRYEGTDYYDQFEDSSISGDVVGLSGLQAFDYRVIEEGGLSRLGKGTIPVLGLIFLLALCAIWKMFSTSRRRVVHDKVGEEDDKDVAASTDDEGQKDDGEEEEEAYVGGDFDNQGACHSRMDVPNCHRKDCIACNRHSTKRASLIDIDIDDNNNGNNNADDIDDDDDDDVPLERSFEVKLDEEQSQAMGGETQEKKTKKKSRSSYTLESLFRPKRNRKSQNEAEASSSSIPLVEVVEETRSELDIDEQEDIVVVQQQQQQEREEREPFVSDEPEKVRFVKVNGSDISLSRRQIRDSSGQVRDEVQL